MKKDNQQKIRIAIVHDNFRYFGGAERVVFALKSIWPDATVSTSTIAWKQLGIYRKTVQKMGPVVSWVQYVPLFAAYPFLYRYFLPFIWSSYDFSGYDIVISSSYAQMSHLIRVPQKTLHICYSHSPPRHLYGYETDFDWKKYWIIRPFVHMGNVLLRRLDFNAANRVDYFIACSKEVKERIKKFYKRNSIVIYPPFQLNSIRQSVPAASPKAGTFYLVVARLSRRKHVDLPVRVCTKYNLPLVVAGSGPERHALRTIAGPSVTFLGEVGNELPKYYRNCIGVICLGRDEESSIVPIEALSHGKPVIALRTGGYKESVVEGKTGLFINTLTEEELIQKIEKLKTFSISQSVRKSQLAKYQLGFFKKNIRRFILAKYHEHTLSQS